MKGDANSLSGSFISVLAWSQAGCLWVGTNDGGLNCFDRKSSTFSHWTTADGLPTNVIYCILEDHNGRLWLSANYGLSRFDVKKETFRNFDVPDGLESNEFNRGAACRSQTGELYFGGINGLTRFHPERIRDDSKIPEIEADPTQMRQLFQNLIANALKYRKPDVSPEVHGSARVIDSIRIQEDGCVRAVCDGQRDRH